MDFCDSSPLYLIWLTQCSSSGWEKKNVKYYPLSNPYLWVTSLKSNNHWSIPIFKKGRVFPSHFSVILYSNLPKNLSRCHDNIFGCQVKILFVYKSLCELWKWKYSMPAFFPNSSTVAFLQSVENKALSIGWANFSQSNLLHTVVAKEIKWRKTTIVNHKERVLKLSRAKNKAIQCFKTISIMRLDSFRAYFQIQRLCIETT